MQRGDPLTNEDRIDRFGQRQSNEGCRPNASSLGPRRSWTSSTGWPRQRGRRAAGGATQSGNALEKKSPTL
jgi:hypothetical protein